MPSVMDYPRVSMMADRSGPFGAVRADGFAPRISPKSENAIIGCIARGGCLQCCSGDNQCPRTAFIDAICGNL